MQFKYQLNNLQIWHNLIFIIKFHIIFIVICLILIVKLTMSRVFFLYDQVTRTKVCFCLSFRTFLFCLSRYLFWSRTRFYFPVIQIASSSWIEHFLSKYCKCGQDRQDAEQCSRVSWFEMLLLISSALVHFHPSSNFSFLYFQPI